MTARDFFHLETLENLLIRQRLIFLQLQDLEQVRLVCSHQQMQVGILSKFLSPFQTISTLRYLKLWAKFKQIKPYLMAYPALTRKIISFY